MSKSALCFKMHTVVVRVPARIMVLEPTQVRVGTARLDWPRTRLGEIGIQVVDKMGPLIADIANRDEVVANGTFKRQIPLLDISIREILLNRVCTRRRRRTGLQRICSIKCWQVDEIISSREIANKGQVN